MESSMQGYFRKSAVIVTMLPSGFCSCVFFVYLLFPSQLDPLQLFPDRLHFIPKMLLAF